MIRSTDMSIERAFMAWKFELLRSKERSILMKKNMKITHLVNLLQRKYHHSLKLGLRVLANEIALTKAQTAVFNKLNAVLWDKLGKWFTVWKHVTFKHLAVRQENLKARCIDRLIQANMSPLRKAFVYWTRFYWNILIVEYGNRLKAWYVIQQYTKKNQELSTIKLFRKTWDKMF